MEIIPRIIVQLTSCPFGIIYSNEVAQDAKIATVHPFNHS